MYKYIYIHILCICVVDQLHQILFPKNHGGSKAANFQPRIHPFGFHFSPTWYRRLAKEAEIKTWPGSFRLMQ